MEKFKIACIIDTYSKGSYHEVINQSYLMMIAELYDKVIYIADKSSCDNLRKLLDSCNVHYDNISFKEKNIVNIRYWGDGINYILKLMVVSFLNYRYYITLPKGCDVFYNNNIFFAISLISLLSKKNKRVFSMCHNEMELIKFDMANSLATKLLSRYFNFIFNKTRINKIFHFILLSPKMVDYFSSFISKEENRRVLFSIDHAYIRPTNSEYQSKIKDTRRKIGITGALNKSRGLNSLRYILNKISNKDICIYSLSSCPEMVDSPQFVRLNDLNRLLPFEEYNSNVRSMDAVLLLYDTDSYKLTASGAILEAIWNMKPIIALRNDYFDYIFRKFGNMGVLCDNIDQLCIKLEIFENKEEYFMSLEKAKQALVPGSVKMQLLEIIKHD